MGYVVVMGVCGSVCGVCGSVCGVCGSDVWGVW